MAEERSHKTTANRIARKLSTEYNPGPGIDIKTRRLTVEVETENTVREAPRQLQGHRGPVYIAGANQRTLDLALQITRGTTIGVMNNQGEIIKSSTRKK